MSHDKLTKVLIALNELVRNGIGIMKAEPENRTVYCDCEAKPELEEVPLVPVECELRSFVFDVRGKKTKIYYAIGECKECGCIFIITKNENILSLFGLKGCLI